MKNKYILPITTIFFAAVTLINIFLLLDYAKKYDGFVIGDWLINYQAGFVRRGLSGQLIISLSDLINIKDNITTFAVQVFFYISYTLILYLLIYKKQINIWFLIMLVSPVTLLFPILGAAGRKEMVLFFLFGIYIFYLNKTVIISPFVILLFSFALMVASLFHELIFFYTPYFILAAYYKSKINYSPFHFSKIALVLIGSFFATIIIFLFGKHLNETVICSGLMQRGLPDIICKGVLAWPENFDLLNYAKINGYFFSYSSTLLLGLIPFVCFFKFAKPQIITLKIFWVSFLFLFLFSLPLFILAIDWGRWLNIHFMMLLFVSTLFLKDESTINETEWSNQYLIIPNLWKSKTQPLKLLNNLTFYILVLTYTTLWGIKCYGSFSVFSFDFYRTFLNLFGGLLKHL